MSLEKRRSFTGSENRDLSLKTQTLPRTSDYFILRETDLFTVSRQRSKKKRKLLRNHTIISKPFQHFIAHVFLLSTQQLKQSHSQAILDPAEILLKECLGIFYLTVKSPLDNYLRRKFL